MIPLASITPLVTLDTSSDLVMALSAGFIMILGVVIAMGVTIISTHRETLLFPIGLVVGMMTIAMGGGVGISSTQRPQMAALESFRMAVEEYGSTGDDFTTHAGEKWFLEVSEDEFIKCSTLREPTEESTTDFFVLCADPDAEAEVPIQEVSRP